MEFNKIELYKDDETSIKKDRKRVTEVSIFLLVVIIAIAALLTIILKDNPFLNPDVFRAAIYDAFFTFFFHIVITVILIKKTISGGKRKIPFIRDWLVNPVLYTVVTGFSITAILNDSKNWLLYISQGVLFIYILIQFFAEKYGINLYNLVLSKRFEDKPRNIYLIISLFFITAIVLLFVVYIPKYPNIPEFVKIPFICAVFSTFIASFEAWKITAEMIKRNDSVEAGNNPYYKSTSAAMCLSIIIVPCLLLSDKFYAIFYFGAIFIGIIACFYWFLRGTTTNRFLYKYKKDDTNKERNWACRKNIFGFSVLVLLCADSILKVPLPDGIRLFYVFFQWQTLYAVFGIFILLARSFLKEYFETKKRKIKEGYNFHCEPNRKRALIVIKIMFANPRNFNRALGILSFLIFTCLFLFDLLGTHSIDNNLIKLRAAEIVYFFISIFCIIFDIGEKMLDFSDKDTSKNQNDGNQNKIIGDKEMSPITNFTLQKIKGIVRLLRFPTVLLIESIVLIPLLANGNSLATSFLFGLPFTLAAMVGFAENDCMDIDKDTISKPHRALPSGLITFPEAQKMTYMMSVLTVISISLISRNLLQAMLYFSAFIGVLTYNYFVKNIALLKVFVAAFISTLPIIFVGIFLKNYFYAIPVALIAFIYISGRELRMDILDQAGDSAACIRTFPLVFGRKVSSRISSFCIYIALLLSVILAIFYNHKVFGYMMIPCIILAQIICELYWYDQSNIKKRRSILFQWFPMIMSLFIFM
jgi:geranylgeranylglycerol-phosphate geranylgeranyltransferase